MEAKQTKEQEESVTLDGYVSPEVALAQHGQPADFSKHLQEEDEAPAAPETDPDA